MRVKQIHAYILADYHYIADYKLLKVSKTQIMQNYCITASTNDSQWRWVYFMTASG